MRRVVRVLLLSVLLLSVPMVASAQQSESTDTTATESVSATETASVTETPALASDEADNALRESRIVVKDQKKKRAFSDKIVVLQRKPIMRKHRLEISPTFVMTANDTLLSQPGVGFNLNFYILDWLYVGANGSWLDWRFVNKSSNGLSDNYKTVIEATDAIPNLSIVNAYVGGVVGFTPVYGKLSLFNSAILHWDFGMAVGGAMISTRAKKFNGAGIITANHHLYLTKWLSLNIEAKGLIYYEDNGSHKGVFTHWEAGVGLGFWLPPSWSYKSDW